MVDGKAFRTLNILDEYTRECLAIRIKRKLNSTDVIDVLSDLFILRGVPAFIRSELPMNAPLVRAPLATAPSSWLTMFESGSAPLAQRPHSSNRAVLGKTDTVKASTAECATSCGTARCSTASETHRSSSKNGEGTTTLKGRTVHWATAHRLRRQSSRWTKDRSCTKNQSGKLECGSSGPSRNASTVSWRSTV